MKPAARLGSWLTLLCVGLCLGPPCAVALVGLGVPRIAAAAIPVAILLALGVWRRDVPALPLELARRHPVLATLWVLVLAAAAIQTARASLYALDATEPRFSVSPGDAFRVQHNCFSSYAEGARLAAAGVENVYDREHYRPGNDWKRIGPLTVDPFHYPPTFLLLPGAVIAAAPDFFDARRVWFGLQVLVLAAALLGAARWVGGELGRRVALGAALIWAVPHTFLALQFGNFQLTAIPMALAGCWLGFASPRARAGGAMLAFAALGKVFPCMLAVHVLAARRWRFVAQLVVWGLILVLATLAIYGAAPFVEFFRDELPELVSGAAFPQTEVPSSIPANQSVYGITTKVRALGATWLDAAAGKRVAQAYALALLVVVVLAGRRLAASGEAVESAPRLARLILWLSILNLASFAGPFVGGGYGTFGTIWLVVLAACWTDSRLGRWAWLLALLPIAVPIFLAPPSPGSLTTPPPAAFVVSMVAPLSALVVNALAMRLALRRAGSGGNGAVARAGTAA